MFKKNTAGQFIHFQGVDSSTGGIKSGVTWTVRRCLDGTFAAATGTASEDGTTGWYKFALSQADTNGNNCGFNFTGTGAVPQTVNIVTDGAPPSVNVDTIKTNAVVNGGTITFPTNATLASTTNITAAAGCAVSSLGANVITAAATAADFGTEIATAIWTDTTAGDFTVAASIGKSIMNGVALGTGLTINAYTGNTVQTGDSFARIGANGVGLTSVALADATSDAVIADAVWNAATASYGSAGTYGLLVETDLDATISSRLATVGYTAPTNLTAAQIATGVWQDTTAGDFTLAASVGKSIMNGVALGTGLTVESVTGAVGSVTGAVGSVTGSVGSVTGLTASDVGAIKAKTDSLAFTVAGQVDANIQSVNDVTVTGTGAAGTEWGP